ncbi:hypothetical protein AARAC_006628 [Aspergillus arachidicola]|uniref:Cysteine-rich transmembrane CYSTM domain-containing protein n=1 Tax=Aspergillus arachidicola TaxID=656916 RepID=A0A2G7EMQ3_9EURO|nr:hypothetical protein AARAC_006628 [Aspergillus arachidicola]
MFDWFKSKEETPTQELRTWDPRTVAMQQPTTPEAATTNQVVSEQPRQQETMHTSLRGGGEGEDVCCGVCTGIACFECCECCC